jgi:hypothetical protein
MPTEEAQIRKEGVMNRGLTVTEVLIATVTILMASAIIMTIVAMANRSNAKAAPLTTHQWVVTVYPQDREPYEFTTSKGLTVDRDSGALVVWRSDETYNYDRIVTCPFDARRVEITPEDQ